MSSAEAAWGMIILVIILIIVIFFFCLLPVYKALQARYTHWEDLENDPRWNADQFQFSPTSPQLGARTPSNKYNRLSVCSDQTVSRGSSFRNNCALPRVEDQVEIKLPPAYSDIFNPGSGDVSSLGTPPAYYSHSTSETEDNDQTAKPNPAQQNQSAVAEQPNQPKQGKPNQAEQAKPNQTEQSAEPAPPPPKPRKTYKKIKKGDTAKEAKS